MNDITVLNEALNYTHALATMPPPEQAPQTTLQRYVAAVKAKRDLQGKLSDVEATLNALKAALLKEYVENGVVSQRCDGMNVTLQPKEFASVPGDIDVSPGARLQMLADYVVAGGRRDDVFGTELQNPGATRDSIVKAAFEQAEMNELPKVTVNAQTLTSVLREGADKKFTDAEKIARAALVNANADEEGKVHFTIETLLPSLRPVVRTYLRVDFSATSARGS